MKGILLMSIVLLAMLSCSKEEVNHQRELNISVKSTGEATNTTAAENVVFYPNPFHDLAYVYISGANGAQLVISDENGNKKSISLTASLVTLDFSNEKGGAYYVEALVNKTVYRTYLIKY